MLGDGPSMELIWGGFVGLGFLGLVLSTVRWWASLPIVVLLGFWALVILDDLYAADLYPTYMRIDPSFVPLATTAIVLGLTLPFIGVVINPARRFRRTT